MKNSVLILLLVSSTLVSAKSYSFMVENPSKFDRTDQPIVLSGQQFGEAIPAGYPIAFLGKKQLPVQADDLDRDGKVDEIALTVNLKALQKEALTLKFAAKPSKKVFSKRVNAQLFEKVGNALVPIKEIASPTGNLYNSLHHHGPAFESEWMAYRFYFDKKQTIDVYGKKQPRLELAESLWYPTDSMLAKKFGDDILLVKDYVSVGTFKGWDGKKAVHIEPVSNRTARILANGPVRTVVEMESDNWQYQRQSVQMTTRAILYAGHRDLEIVNYVTAADLPALTFCTGVQKFPEMTAYEKEDMVAVWGRNWPVADTVKYEKETVGLAVFCPEETMHSAKIEDESNFLYLLNGSPVIRYYATVYWKKQEGGVQTAQEFFNELPKWKQCLVERVLVRPKR
ncbi:MAG: DUF4861 domain-containing protein [Bacteroidia bacterium]|nr:DUF4861 domain-containing protein [Bacteroidia bacterium]